MDETDIRIIAALRLDASAPVRVLAKRLGMRPSTLHARVQRLAARGVVKRYTVEIDHAKFGDDFLAFVMVKGGPERYIDDAFLGRPEVEGVYPVTGEHDLLLKLRFRSLRDFNRFVMEFRERYRRHVRETLSMVALGTLKDGA